MVNRICAFLAIVLVATSASGQTEVPKVADERLVVELVAAAPDIVHPISCDFDHKGRLLVIESHTHFAPKDYKGPKFDRIRAFDVKTGKATTFFEGTKATMDLAVHFDGSVYIATRNEILRLRETKDGVKSKRIVFLDTKGDYPHNGLSGLCFDSKGDLTFGMGENLGAKYTLIGSDDVKISGEGDGGHIFHCSADGKKLRKVATGFWNPFGICRDIYGRTFCVENDPDQAPPCRMLHIVEGGDYGFRFCYGRSGKHPFQSWHGELPGTLPMMTGVGEAPCEILSYESDGLPKEYLGQLMVTSWADHRVERYQVKPHGASFKAERLPFVQGGNNFRPVGLCTAPDGSLYVTDWVLSNYELHGKGAIWRIRWKDEKASRERKRPEDPREAIFSMHRPLREAAARKLAGDEAGREFLREQLKHSEARVRASALSELANIGDRKFDFRKTVDKDREIGLRELAILHLANRGDLKAADLLKLMPPSLEAIVLEGAEYSPSDRIVNSDPFLRHAAIRQFSRSAYVRGIELGTGLWKDRDYRISRLLASHATAPSNTWRALTLKTALVDDDDEDVRFLAVKWVADEKVTEHRKNVEKLMADPKISVRMHIACATALARIDGKNVDERSLADHFANRLADDKLPELQRAALLKLVPANHPKLTVDLLAKLLKSDDAALKFEAVRALVERPSDKQDGPLLSLLRDEKASEALRAWAVVGLAQSAARYREDLFNLALKGDATLRDEALRAFINVPQTVMDLEDLSLLAIKHKDAAPLVARVQKIEFFKDRPPTKNLDAWLKRLEGKADADAGARVFFHPKLGGCYKCHRIDGRGQDVGPDLSNIGRTDRRRILESILQPSANVAPHYVAWHLESAAGKVRTGMLVHTYLDEYTYLDAKGERFKVKTGDLVEQRPTAVSIMPDGLIDVMTDQEVRDLLAYLESRK